MQTTIDVFVNNLSRCALENLSLEWKKNIAEYVFVKYLIKHVDISILKSYITRVNFWF